MEGINELMINKSKDHHEKGLGSNNFLNPYGKPYNKIALQYNKTSSEREQLRRRRFEEDLEELLSKLDLSNAEKTNLRLRYKDKRIINCIKSKFKNYHGRDTKERDYNLLFIAFNAEDPTTIVKNLEVEDAFKTVVNRNTYYWSILFNDQRFDKTFGLACDKGARVDDLYRSLNKRKTNSMKRFIRFIDIHNILSIARGLYHDYKEPYLKGEKKGKRTGLFAAILYYISVELTKDTQCYLPKPKSKSVWINFFEIDRKTLNLRLREAARYIESQRNI